jgi:hypothetical protein
MIKTWVLYQLGHPTKIPQMGGPETSSVGPCLRNKGSSRRHLKHALGVLAILSTLGR